MATVVAAGHGAAPRRSGGSGGRTAGRGRSRAAGGLRHGTPRWGGRSSRWAGPFRSAPPGWSWPRCSWRSRSSPSPSIDRWRRADSSVRSWRRWPGSRRARGSVRVTLPSIRGALLAGGVLAWARAFGEFGATLTLAGSFPGRTQTLPQAVYLAVVRRPGRRHRRRLSDDGRRGVGRGRRGWGWCAARGRSGQFCDHVVDTRRERGDVGGVDGREHGHPQLVSPQLPVGLDVEDAVGPQGRGDRWRRRRASSMSMVATTWLRLAGSDTKGVASSCASAQSYMVAAEASQRRAAKSRPPLSRIQRIC